ncbi:PREDICTED: fascin-like [Amphimedon queenslandica]|uniref:Fascin n=1 Tax=Amphimedon queenslandica TaxID=400682 RepID=A0A1X7VU79_AMPQE|nr:PREDICTED: fascin-like [Amphimedon queenslandica]|eukprot:XP_003382884.1 PREDICTED: fascin-like [Amphimedon queenslandica]
MAVASAKSWTVGLINSANKFLTAEKFQFKVNANGTSLRKKQYWILEDAGSDMVAIKSSFGRYLGSDKDGKITADAEEVGDDNRFILETRDDGKVAIKSSKHGRYFGGTGDNLSGFDKEVSATSLWTIQLAIMPQLNLFNVNRKAYAHLDVTNNEIRVNEVIPWGFDSTISIDFHEGKYSIRAANGSYLECSGALVEKLNDNCLYTIVYRGTQVAFRDNAGKYLAGVGANAVLQSRKSSISKDELFTFEDTNPQITLIAFNKKYVSQRQGVEVRANQTDVTDDETFQIMAVDRSDLSGNVKWAVCNKKLKFWNSESNLVAKSNDFSSPDCQFSIVWQGPMVLFQANNGKYLKVTSNGQLSATGGVDDAECKFVLEIINHPILTLRSEFGFVGSKGASGILECNRSQYDVFRLKGNAGTYRFETSSGNQWKVEGDNILANAPGGSDFFIEFRAHTRMCIVAPNGKCIQSAQNGDFKPVADDVTPATLWEF